VSLPSQPPINEIFQQHRAEVRFWERVASLMADELRKIVRYTRTPAKVEARAKTTGSVIGKAYRKGESSWHLADFADLAGARVLVPFESDIEPIVSEIVGHPDLAILRDETKVRRPDELTYQARHLDVQLSPEFAQSPEDFGDRAVRCEVQIQTLAQNLWANLSHLVTYKRILPAEVHSRVNRLVVLCELFDDEATESRALALGAVDTVGVIADELQRYFFGLTGVQHDPEQAVTLVARLLPSLEESEQADYPALLDSFVHGYGPRLTLLLTDHPEARQVAWLLRPEVILIFERLTRRPARLRQVWNSEFAAADLDALSAAWGPVGHPRE
jgi:ppGpp synthetase/RelA/SpoT-type nucleotidyltranferase